MTDCRPLVDGASAGVAAALRAVDCVASETTASAFGRLFGGGGPLMPLLTILLTLYIAFFAISLLTGRSRIGVSALTPRMMTLGLVLTFATSWVAYQSVVWNLAIGGPDQIAGALMGSQGSATLMFADRIDIVFNAIAETAALAADSQAHSSGAAAGAAASSFTPTNLMWLSAMLLLLGTVGVLVTARIALAVLLAVGPIFVVFALFAGTRGLFVGWLRGVVLTAVTPLFAVLGGGFMLELIVPVIAGLRGADGIDGRAAMALFMIAAVYIALMSMVLRVAGTMVAGWQVFGLAAVENKSSQTSSSAMPAATQQSHQIPAMQQAASANNSRRSAAMVIPQDNAQFQSPAPPSTTITRNGRTFMTPAIDATSGLPPLARQRARGIGSRFRAPTSQAREMIR
jgi:type IV secretion system protein VirB6